MKALEEYDILDESGMILRKPDLFNELYSETGGNVGLYLIMENSHPVYSLRHRKSFDKALVEQEHILELTRNELTQRAIGIARRIGTCENFDNSIMLMVEGMIDVLDNHKEIEKNIKVAK